MATAMARAGDLFSFAASGTDSSGTAISTSAGGSSLVNLTRSLADNSAQFAAFKNQNFTANLRYGDFNNALVVSQTVDSSTGVRTLELKSPTTGLDKTFSTANGSLADQLRDYLLKSGSSDLADFYQSLNQHSTLGVTDGNPLAATALYSDDMFNRFGLHRSPFQLNGEGYSGGVENRFNITGGAFNSSGGSGYFAGLTFDTAFRFGDVVGLSIGVPLYYRATKGSGTYFGGLTLGLPINIVPGSPESSDSVGFYWTITPAGTGAVAASADLATGGVLWGVGGTNSIGVVIAGFNIGIANQYTYYRGAKLPTIDGYEFQTHVDQQVLKNGVQLSKSFGNFFIDASISYTNFLNSAAVGHYYSPAAGLGFRFGASNASGLRVGYAGDFGNGYHVNGGDIELFFSN